MTDDSVVNYLQRCGMPDTARNRALVRKKFAQAESEVEARRPITDDSVVNYLQSCGIPGTARNRAAEVEAQTGAERQAGHRARMAMLGFKEVRGIYLPLELHKVLREAARKLLEKRK